MAERRTQSWERRARRKRAQARIRLTLLQDKQLLDSHHASSPPRVQRNDSARASHSADVSALLAQQSVLLTAISSLVVELGRCFTNGAVIATAAPDQDVVDVAMTSLLRANAAEFIPNSPVAPY